MSAVVNSHAEQTANHYPFADVYANSTARLAATGFPKGLGGSILPFETSDVGKFARQSDDNSVWMLTAITPTWLQVSGPGSTPFEMGIACSDESTALTTGTAKVTFRMPCGVTLTAIRASLSTAQSSGSIFTVDVNEGGSTILSTKITIDNGEKTSTSAATPPVISDAALADDAEISIDIDQVGDGTAKGLKIYLIGTRS